MAVFALFFTTAFAGTLPAIQLAWDENPEGDIASYELRYGPAVGNYPYRIDTGTTTTASVKGLIAGVTYYFVVIARNRAGFASSESAAVTYRGDEPASSPPNGTIAYPAGDLAITAGDTVEFAGKGSDPSGNSPLTYQWSFGSGVPGSQAQNPGPRRFDEPGTYTAKLIVTNATGQVDPTPATRTIVVNRPTYRAIPRSGWKLNHAASQDAPGHPATAAFDGNPRTFWLARSKRSGKPQEIQIDLGSSRLISGFQYLPRQDGNRTGNLTQFKFHVSRDGVKWGSPIAVGAFGNSSALKQATFTPTRGRYIRLLSVSEVNSACNVAELKILQSEKPKRHSAANLPAANRLAPVLPAVTTEVIGGRKFLTLTVAKPRVPDGVKHAVEVSSDLLDWSSGNGHTTVVTDDDHRLKVRDNTPVTRDAKRYIRLKPLPR